MKNFSKYAAVLIGGIIVGLLFSAVSTSGKLGGVYNQTANYFYDGLFVGTSNQLAIDKEGVVGTTSSGLNAYNAYETPTADATLTVAQTGTTFNLGTAGVDLTLPAVATSNGVSYRFQISAAYATTNITVVSAEGDNIDGTLVVAGAVVDCDATDVITSVADGENVGDFFELRSNGTNWIIGASGSLTASKLTCSG